MKNWKFNGETIIDTTGANACTKGNGKLIAAAPELLAALEMFVAQYQGNGNDHREQRPEMIAARAAIKKARS